MISWAILDRHLIPPIRFYFLFLFLLPFAFERSRILFLPTPRWKNGAFIWFWGRGGEENCCLDYLYRPACRYQLIPNLLFIRSYLIRPVISSHHMQISRSLAGQYAVDNDADVSGDDGAQPLPHTSLRGAVAPARDQATEPWGHGHPPVPVTVRPCHRR